MTYGVFISISAGVSSVSIKKILLLGTAHYNIHLEGRSWGPLLLSIRFSLVDGYKVFIHNLKFIYATFQTIKQII